MKFLLIVTAVHLDTAFTHGYGETCMPELVKPLEKWFLSMNYEIDKPIVNEVGKETENENLIISPTIFGYVDGAFSFGAAFGSLFFINFFANEFGRKGGIIMAACISVFASIFCGYSKYFESAMVLLLGRFLYGVKTGINSALAPMYMMEIAPKGSRGQFGSMYGVFLSIGGFFGIIVGCVLGNDKYWPLVLSLCVIPAVIQLIILPSFPESPRYLYAIKGNEVVCKKSLRWLREDSYNEEEFYKLRKEFVQSQAIGKIRLKDITDNIILRQALLMTTIIQMSQQLCGFAMVNNYVTEYFEKEIDEIIMHTVSSSFLYINLMLMGFIGFFTVSQVSRRKVYMISYISMSIMCLVMCIVIVMPPFELQRMCFYVCAILYLAAYKAGPGLLSWFFPSELFSTAAAPIAYSIGLFMNWLVYHLMIIFFKSFSQYLGGYGFLNYVMSNGFLAYFTYHRLPNTTGKSLKYVYSEIYETYKRNNF